MVKQLSILVLSCLLLQSAFGQKIDTYRNIIKSSPTALLGGPIWAFAVVPMTAEYRLVYEFHVRMKETALIGFSYLGPSAATDFGQISNTNSTGQLVFDIAVRGYRAQAGYRYYFDDDTHMAPYGFYIGPHATYAYCKIYDEINPSDYIEAVKWGGNFIVGYQLIKHGLAVDVFIGAGFKSKSWNYNAPGLSIFNTFTERKSLNMPLGFNIGYAF